MIRLSLSHYTRFSIKWSLLNVFRAEVPRFGRIDPTAIFVWTKGIPTEAEKKETERQIQLIMEQWAVTTPSQREMAMAMSKD